MKIFKRADAPPLSLIFLPAAMIGILSNPAIAKPSLSPPSSMATHSAAYSQATQCAALYHSLMKQVPANSPQQEEIARRATAWEAYGKDVAVTGADVTRDSAAIEAKLQMRLLTTNGDPEKMTAIMGPLGDACQNIPTSTPGLSDAPGIKDGKGKLVEYDRFVACSAHQFWSADQQEITGEGLWAGRHLRQRAQLLQQQGAKAFPAQSGKLPSDIAVRKAAFTKDFAGSSISLGRRIITKDCNSLGQYLLNDQASINARATGKFDQALLNRYVECAGVIRFNTGAADAAKKAAAAQVIDQLKGAAQALQPDLRSNVLDALVDTQYFTMGIRVQQNQFNEADAMQARCSATLTVF